MIFGGSVVFKKLRFLRRGVLGMTIREQQKFTPNRPMSMVLWNMFTGSAPYRAILAQTLRPGFFGNLGLHLLLTNLFRRKKPATNGDPS